jgi:hypothetical protein
MVARRTLLATAAAMVAVILGVAVAATASPQQSLSPSCDALSVTPKNYPFAESSFAYVCGQQSVSDGRLSVTLNGYRFADGSSIDWQCPAGSHNGSSSSCPVSGFFLLVNATIQNVGSGNASVGPSFQVWMSDTAGSPVENGELGANASFPGQHPSSSIPSVDGGVYLPPGAKASYWLIFNLPGVSQRDTPDLTLKYLVLRELSYGGEWEGGSFACGPCETPDVQLIVTGAA